jgi:hypothetical protein
VSPPREPSLFISHKHVDRKIADVIREFVYQRTNREVSVFQSSAADSETPELGRVLSAELKEALWKTGVVILIYTTEDQDWQWCMWECGVATKQASPDTRIIVFQCSVQAPRVFQDSVRVNAREHEDVLKFVRAFLTDPNFFPDMGRAVAPRLAPNGDEVKKAADAFFAALADVVPKSDVAEWATQPLLQLQLPADIADKIAAEGGDQGELGIQVADVTVVSTLDPQARQIFGVADLAPGTKLSGLAMRWAEKKTGREVAWVRDIEAQVRRAARNDIPAIGWGYLQDTDNTCRYVPLLSRVRRIPALRILQFDVNLVPFDEFAATRVVARMIPLKEVVCHRIERIPLAELKVIDLARRFRDERLSRMPFLTEDNRVKLIIHQSMVDRYVAGRVTAGNLENLAAASVFDMLQDDAALKRLFESSFSAVPPTARLREVNAIMAASHDVQDVFVTATGKPEDPVIGWITNTMLAQHLA